MLTLEMMIAKPCTSNDAVQITAIKEQIKQIGLETFNLLQTFEHMRGELQSHQSQKPHVYWQLVYEFIRTLATEDPNRLHYDIIREALPDIEEARSRDMIARSLNEFCKKIKIKLKEATSFYAILQAAKTEINELSKAHGETADNSFEILELPSNSEFEASFEKDGMFIWDTIFIQHLVTIGTQGAIYAKDIKKTRKNKLNEFKEIGKNPLGFWFNITADMQPLYLSPAFMLAAMALWEDQIKRLANFGNRYTPALTSHVQEPIKKILSPHNYVQEIDQEFHVYNSNKSIGSIKVPTISQNISATVFNGMKKFNSVMGHRLIRFFPQRAFDQMINGEGDYRILRFNRGATDILEQLKLAKSPKTITLVNQILHAMAHCEFHSLYLTGNLIQLSKYKSPITHRQDEAYLITIGTPLLPYQTFEDGGLLIPLLSDPPLVNPNQYHAAQYLLQMEIMSEMSNQSMELAQNDVIHIPQSKWELFANTCGLPRDILEKVQDKWTQDGTNHPLFLQKIEKEFYTLGSHHKKALEFLKLQGIHRLKQSKRGKKAALKHKNS